MSKTVRCRSLSSTHVLYNQALVGGLSVSFDPARQIHNLQLPGGSTSGDSIVHPYSSALVSDNASVDANNTACSSAARPKSDQATSDVISSLPLVYATVDSGCSATCTHDCSLLVNTAPCNEVFGAANGLLATATSIGNLPLVARAQDGKVVHFVLTNVRCVPAFSNFTLLSVDQMWEEQRIRSSFCDNKQLEMPSCGGGHVLPYDSESGRNTIKFASAVKLYDAGILDKHPSVTQRAKVALGFHDMKSTAHVARLSSSQVGELMSRRLLRPVQVIRAVAATTSDGPANLSRAQKFANPHTVVCNISKPSHGGARKVTERSTLAPCTEHGTFHVDLKGPMTRSANGFQYAMFLVEEYSRFVFVEFLKSKEAREQAAAVARAVSRFNSLVNVGSDADGRPLPKPKVTVIRSDHEGALESKLFESFRSEFGIAGGASHMSPPHDHDLNPIAERCIGVVSANACAARSQSNASASLWPWLCENAVNIHNSTTGSSSDNIGSSTADPLVTPYQRLTLSQPSIMDLATFGCRAVVLKPPSAIKKSDLSTRGWVGQLLGRSLGGCRGQWDVLAEGKIVSSSSVQIDEENLPWHRQASHQPLRPTTQPLNASDSRNESPGGEDKVPSVCSLSNRDSLCVLNLFCGPYSRAEGLSGRLTDEFGWSKVYNVDNNSDTGGGWAHDILNDSFFTELISLTTRGAFDAMVVAFPCSTFSAARLFKTNPPGPPAIRTKSFPDGLDAKDLDPKHAAELSRTKILLDRTIQLWQ